MCWRGVKAKSGRCLAGWVPPMPNSASMVRSQRVGGESAKITPACRANPRAQRASAGMCCSLPHQVTVSVPPFPVNQGTSNAAVNKPSPPLFPGPQATQTLVALGVMDFASLAAANAARAIRVCGGRVLASATSISRVAAMPCKGCVWLLPVIFSMVGALY